MSARRQNNAIPEGFHLVHPLFLIKERDIRQFKSDVKKTLLEMSNVGLQHSPVVGFCTDVVKLQVLLQYGVYWEVLKPTVQDVLNWSVQELMTGGKGKGQRKIVHNMKSYRGRKLWLRPFLTSTLHASEWLASPPDCFTTGKKPRVQTE
jgi:hypothetical protein